VSSVVSADKGGVDGNNVSGTRLVMNTSFESDNGNNNSEPPQPPPELPPLDIPCHHKQINAAESNRGEEATPHPLGDINVALRRASSSLRSVKTKNSSNKNKERTSIAGAFVKLLEQQQPSSMNSECNERLAMMTMRITCQMENLNKSMDYCDRRDHQERKRWKKNRAKKRTRKRKKHHALEGLDDHGGKAGREVGSSSSSSSSSSSNNSSNKDSDQSSIYGRGHWQVDK